MRFPIPVFRCRLSRFRRDDRGAVLVEFAIVLPFLMLILFGVVAWGISMSMMNSMYDTARSCARSVAVGAVAADAVAASPACQVTSWPGTYTVAGQVLAGSPDLAQVTISTGNPVAFLGGVVPIPATMRAVVAMPVEGTATATAATGGGATPVATTPATPQDCSDLRGRERGECESGRDGDDDDDD